MKLEDIVVVILNRQLRVKAENLLAHWRQYDNRERNILLEISKIISRKKMYMNNIYYAKGT